MRRLLFSPFIVRMENIVQINKAKIERLLLIEQHYIEITNRSAKSIIDGKQSCAINAIDSTLQSIKKETMKRKEEKIRINAITWHLN